MVSEYMFASLIPNTSEIPHEKSCVSHRYSKSRREYLGSNYVLGRAGDSMPVPYQHMPPCLLGMLGACWGPIHGDRLLGVNYLCRITGVNQGFADAKTAFA